MRQRLVDEGHARQDAQGEKRGDHQHVEQWDALQVEGISERENEIGYERQRKRPAQPEGSRQRRSDKNRRRDCRNREGERAAGDGPCRLT